MKRAIASIALLAVLSGCALILDEDRPAKLHFVEKTNDYFAQESFTCAGVYLEASYHETTVTVSGTYPVQKLNAGALCFMVEQSARGSIPLSFAAALAVVEDAKRAGFTHVEFDIDDIAAKCPLYYAALDSPGDDEKYGEGSSSCGYNNWRGPIIENCLGYVGFAYSRP